MSSKERLAKFQSGSRVLHDFFAHERSLFEILQFLEMVFFGSSNNFGCKSAGIAIFWHTKFLTKYDCSAKTLVLWRTVQKLISAYFHSGPEVMGALRSLVAILMFVSSAWGGCRQADWQVVLDRGNVWATCNANEYMRGLWRHDNIGEHDERLGRIEFADCCRPPASYGNPDANCVTANWWSIFDRYTFT